MTNRACARRVLLAGLLVVTMAGCSLHVVMGRRPDVTLLETTLKVGESTQADVRRVLGEPVGRSLSAMPIEPQPRVLWTYYYEEGSLKDVRQFFLLVYLAGDRYDGYLWFSSLPR